VYADGVAFASEAFTRAVAQADLVVTAVGARKVAGLAVPLVRGLSERPGDRPIDVWTVENSDAAPVLNSAVQHAAKDQGAALPPIGVAGAIAGVVVSRGDWKRSHRPEFVGDSSRWLLVDETRLVRPVPPLPGVAATHRYRDELREKLLGFNSGHALCAYLGALRGHRMIHEAVGDPLVRAVVHDSLLLSRAALVATWPRTLADVEKQPLAAIQRYANAELRDTIRRVARDPVRKLAPDGPLVGPARLVWQVTGSVPEGLAAGIAAALAYRDPRDRESQYLGTVLRREGVAGTLHELCGLESDEPIVGTVTRLFPRLVEGDLPATPVERVPA
jgi:mannitol-1-phosphate 5-dehydrogenase